MRRYHLLASAAALVFLSACGDTPDTDTASNAGPPAAAAPARSAQTAASGGAEGSVPLRISAVVGGRSYEASGTGACTHTNQASIYDVRAAQWRAAYSAPEGDVRSLNLTIWQPAADGPDQANLTVQIGDRTHQIATVQGGRMIGQGTASAGADGAAGTLTVDGEDADGTALRVTIECDRLEEPVAEGG